MAQPHIAFLPSPGMGHLIPLAEFAKRLVHHHSFTCTFIIPTNTPPSTAYLNLLNSLPTSIHHIFLPPVDLSDLQPSQRAETLISLTLSRSLTSLRTTLASILQSTKLVALVVDLFGTDAFDPAIELGISPYIFFPSTAMALSLFLYLPKLDQSITCEYRRMTNLIRIPGCSIPIRGSELPDPFQDRKDEAYKWVIHHAKRHTMAEGIVENSFMELEHGALNYLQTVEQGKPPVYAVGPLIKMDYELDTSGSEIIKWLDRQPIGSVIFVSFGSGGTLTFNQLTELAHGLELSQHRFIWVVRSPSQVPNGTFFTLQSQNDPLAYLPEGFLNRIKGRGLVEPDWAPQAQILSHGSTGGFISHCGWNSILESVVHGVPIIAWPLYAEQKMNSIIVVDDVKVALRPRGVGERLVERLEVAEVVKALMEGEEGKRVKTRMMELKEAAARAISHDGASTKAISDLARKWNDLPGPSNRLA